MLFGLIEIKVKLSVFLHLMQGTNREGLIVVDFHHFINPFIREPIEGQHHECHLHDDKREIYSGIDQIGLKILSAYDDHLVSVPVE